MPVLFKKKKTWVKNIPVQPYKFVPRAEWGATEPGPGSDEDKLEVAKRPVERVIIQYTNQPMCEETDECIAAIREMQKTDIANGFADIKYNFLVCGDGRVYEGRGWKYWPPLSPTYPEHHRDSYELAHIGMHNKHPLPNYMSKAAWDQFEVGIKEGHLVEDYAFVPDVFMMAAEENERVGGEEWQKGMDKCTDVTEALFDDEGIVLE